MRDKFPIFKKHNHLAYLDTAATSQLPSVVIDGMSTFLQTNLGSPHRGSYSLSVEATKRYEASREAVRTFFNVPPSHEVIFVKSVTEALNFLGYSLGKQLITENGNVVVPITSHHANILPWQRLRDEKGNALRFVENDEGNHYNYQQWMDIVDDNTSVMSFPWVTNGLGIDVDVPWLLSLAKKHNAMTIVDAAQVVAHQKIDLSDVTPDFFVFSAHKMYGPQGIGVLIGRKDLLQVMPPYQLGGDMIEFVTKEYATYADIPSRFEAGTQNVIGAVGLHHAIDFLSSIGMDSVEAKEQELLSYCFERLKKHPAVTILGPTSLRRRKGLIVFNVNGVHPHDVASLLDDDQVAIRAGHHCCQPLNSYLRTPATCRVSFGVYNTKEDIDQMMDGIDQVLTIMGLGRR